MSVIHYNADEIFEMAEQIERNGAFFYLRAAEFVGDEDAKMLFQELANWEKQHEKTFKEFREEFRKMDPPVAVESDSDDLVGSYLRSIADGYVFDVKEEPADRLTGDESMEDVLKMAFEQEKNSIIFYLGMQQEMPVAFGQERLDRIIREEMGHITALTKLANELKK